MQTYVRTQSRMRDADFRYRHPSALDTEYGREMSSQSHDTLRESMYTSSLRLNLAPYNKTAHFATRGARRKSSPDSGRAPNDFGPMQHNASIDELKVQQSSSREAIALFMLNKRKTPSNSLSSRSLSSIATNPPTVKEEEECGDHLFMGRKSSKVPDIIEVVIDDENDDASDSISDNEDDNFTLMDFLKSTQVVDNLDQEMSLTDFLRVSEDFGPSNVPPGADLKGSVLNGSNSNSPTAISPLSTSSSDNSVVSSKSCSEPRKATLCLSPTYNTPDLMNRITDGIPASNLKAPDVVPSAKRAFVHRSKSINNIEVGRRGGSFKGLLRSKSNTASDRNHCTTTPPPLTPTQMLTQTSIHTPSIHTGVHEVPVNAIPAHAQNNQSYTSLSATTRSKPRAERAKSMGHAKNMRIAPPNTEQKVHLRKQSAPVSSKNDYSNSNLDTERESREKDKEPRSSPKSPSKHISRAWKRVTEIKSSFTFTPSNTDGDNTSSSQLDSSNGDQPIFGTSQAKSSNSKQMKPRECVTWGGVESTTAKTPKSKYIHQRVESRINIPLSASDEGSAKCGGIERPPFPVRQRRSLPMNQLAPLNGDSVTCGKVFLHDELFEGCCNNTTGLAHGLGSWADKDDSTYAGEWFEGEPHGYGSYASLSRRCWFEGRFVKGQAHGFGKLLFIDRYTLDPVYFYGEFRHGRYIHGSTPKDERQRANNAVIIARRASFCANKQSGEAMRSVVTNRLQTWTRRIAGQSGTNSNQRAHTPRMTTSAKASFYWLDNPVLKCQVYLPQITTEAVVARGGQLRPR